MPGFPLTGIDPRDPIPGIVREIRFQQGSASGGGSSRPVVLMGNKTPSGSEPTDTLGAPLNDEDDAIERLGYRSELLLMYRAYVAVDPRATVYAIALAEGQGSTPSTVTLTIQGVPNAPTSIEVRLLGESIEVAIQPGEPAFKIAQHLADMITTKVFWPVLASVGQGPNNTNVITFTCANNGPRGDYVLATLRARVFKSVGVTVVKGPITSGAVDDSVTAALAALDRADIYYQVSAKTTLGDGSVGNPVVTPVDGGVGEHAEFVKAQSLPAKGKAALAIMALGGTAAQAATVGLAVNNVRVVLVHAKHPEWTPAMIAAHVAAVKRSREIAHPGANLRGYGLKGNDVFRIPDPYRSSDRLTDTEIRVDLNNGVTPIAHTSTGRASIVRQITASCQSGGNYDYRARSGHIPSCVDFFWDAVRAAYVAQQQDFVAADPPKGAKPLPNVQYPSALKALINAEIDRAIDFAGGPYLDPSALDAMKAATEVLMLQDGLSARATPIAVRHNNKGQFLLLESSAPY